LTLLTSAAAALDSAPMPCGMCDGQLRPFATTTVLRKYHARYFRCLTCHAIQTEPPYWLGEAYSRPIAAIDLGVVNRAITLAPVARALIVSLFARHASFLDYGGGYGLFVRIMRDAGFDFYNFDRYCPNLFAETFTARAGDGRHYELATAFEVFEHFPDPLRGVQDILRFSKTILFTTLLLPAESPPLDQWWYYAPDTGQHVAFYTRKALSLMAARLGLNLYTDGGSLHLFTERALGPRLVRGILRQTLFSKLLRRVLERRMRTRSLLAEDFTAVSGLRFR
jgi:methyltransferase family protein